EPAEDGRIWPLAYGVETFNLRYLDGRTGEWMDEWDTRAADTANRLPRAVQIGLVLLAGDPDGDDDDTIEVPYLTTVILEYADPLTPLMGMPGEEPPRGPRASAGSGTSCSASAGSTVAPGAAGRSVPAVPGARSAPAAAAAPGWRCSS